MVQESLEGHRGFARWRRWPWVNVPSVLGLATLLAVMFWVVPQQWQVAFGLGIAGVGCTALAIRLIVDSRRRKS